MIHFIILNFDEIGNLIYSHLFIAACLQFTCDAKHNSYNLNFIQYQQFSRQHKTNFQDFKLVLVSNLYRVCIAHEQVSFRSFIFQARFYQIATIAITQQHVSTAALDERKHSAATLPSFWFCRATPCQHRLNKNLLANRIENRKICFKIAHFFFKKRKKFRK